MDEFKKWCEANNGALPRSADDALVEIANFLKSDQRQLLRNDSDGGDGPDEDDDEDGDDIIDEDGDVDEAMATAAAVPAAPAAAVPAAPAAPIARELPMSTLLKPKGLSSLNELVTPTMLAALIGTTNFLKKNEDVTGTTKNESYHGTIKSYFHARIRTMKFGHVVNFLKIVSADWNTESGELFTLPNYFGMHYNDSCYDEHQLKQEGYKLHDETEWTEGDISKLWDLLAKLEQGDYRYSSLTSYLHIKEFPHFCGSLKALLRERRVEIIAEKRKELKAARQAAAASEAAAEDE